jgi:hypothetical protein
MYDFSNPATGEPGGGVLRKISNASYEGDMEAMKKGVREALRTDLEVVLRHNNARAEVSTRLGQRGASSQMPPATGSSISIQSNPQVSPWRAALANPGVATHSEVTVCLFQRGQSRGVKWM